MRTSKLRTCAIDGCLDHSRITSLGCRNEQLRPVQRSVPFDFELPLLPRGISTGGRFCGTNHSIAFWDNRCTQHYAIWGYWQNVRLGYRMFVKGTVKAI
jgi:hypothetical protein